VRLPESAIAVQIDTTLHRLETRIRHGFQRLDPAFKRTVVGAGIEKSAANVDYTLALRVCRANRQWHAYGSAVDAEAA
jgi:hypothetical protein